MTHSAEETEKCPTCESPAPAAKYCLISHKHGFDAIPSCKWCDDPWHSSGTGRTPPQLPECDCDCHFSDRVKHSREAAPVTGRTEETPDTYIAGMMDAARIVRERKGKYTLVQTANYLEALCTSQSNPEDPREAASEPPQDAGFDAATETRWQTAIYELCKKVVGPENDHLIDGGGTDSGDALDFTLSEISQAIAFFADKAETNGK